MASPTSMTVLQCPTPRTSSSYGAFVLAIPLCADVSRTCVIRTAGNSQTDLEYFFPLLLHDLNQDFLDKVVPLILPVVTSFTYFWGPGPHADCVLNPKP